MLLSSKSIFVGSVLSGAETKEKISTEINGTDYGVSHIRKIKWKIKVNSTLKGTRKTGEIVNIVSPKLVVPHNEIDRNNCLQSLDFKANAEYLVFENSFHPKGYLEVEKATDLLKLLKRQQSK